jgi:hypothetical protein
MKTWLIAIMAMFSSLALAEVKFPAPYLNQNLHVERFVFEGWSGSYIQSLYVSATDSVRWEYCRSVNDWQQPCQALLDHNVNRRDLPYYQAELVRKLESYRASLAQKANNRFFAKFLGGAEADSDVAAVDDVLAALKQEPLAFLILQREPERSERLVFSGIKNTDAVARILKSVFNTPVDSDSGPAIADSKQTPLQ